MPEGPSPERPIRILHAHSTFSLGGKEARAVRLMNAMGGEAEHVIWSAMPDALSAREAIAPGVAYRIATDAPPLAGRPTPGRLRRVAAYSKSFDLVLTYNWGAFDAVMARRLFGGPPLVHHEDGFNEDEAERLKTRRNLYRRFGLPAAHALVVPSERLERIALERWRQPRTRVARIGNGVPVARYSGQAKAAIPAVERRPGELLIGSLAGLRAVKNLPLLVRAFAAAPHRDARLVIVGEGPERERIRAEAQACGVADRLVLPGFLPDPHLFMGAFDIFALSSDSEQQPISLMEAMAAGCAVAATMVGDVPAMVSEANKPFMVSPGDERGLAGALTKIMSDADLRRQLGEANRERAQAEYDERVMIAKYLSLYREAIRPFVRS